MSIYTYIHNIFKQVGCLSIVLEDEVTAGCHLKTVGRPHPGAGHQWPRRAVAHGGLRLCRLGHLGSMRVRDDRVDR